MTLVEFLERMDSFDFAILIGVGIALFHCITVSTLIVSVVRRPDSPDEANQPWWGRLSTGDRENAVSATASRLWQRLVQFINAEHNYTESSPLLEYLEDVWPSIPPFDRGAGSLARPVRQKQIRAVPLETEGELESPLLVEDLPAATTKGSGADRMPQCSPRSSPFSKAK